MKAPVNPPDEQARIAELHGLCLLDTPFEERFDRITRTAQRLFGVASALVSLVDTDRQWFKSAQGLDAAETPRSISFCGHAILNQAAFVIEDAAADPRFSDNPLVTGAPYIRFYAGMPLRGPNGYRVGTLCLLDPSPRRFPDADIAALSDLAQLVEAEFNTRELSQTVMQAQTNAARLRSILDNVVDGIMTIDARGLIETVNPAVLHMFGYTESEVCGHDIERLIPQFWPDGDRDYLHNMRDGGDTTWLGVDHEVLGCRKDGTRFPLELAFSMMPLKGRRAFTGIVRDITARKQAKNVLVSLNRKLAATTALQQAIWDSANFSLIASDLAGVIKMFSTGAERMLGYAREEVIDIQTPAILHDVREVIAHAAELTVELGRPVAPGFEAFVAKARDGKADEREWTYIHKDGRRFPVMLSVTALKDEVGELSGFLGIAYDLTERKKIEQMKNDFISTVSHELRTPLTSIRGSLGLLAGGAVGEIPQKANVLLGIASSNCERLVRLINDILDVEKIESGNMRFDLVRQPILPLVMQAIESTQSYAAQHGVRLVLSPDSVDAELMIDADRLMQVVVNLLSNAAKFSPDGAKVSVRLSHHATCFRTSVIDQGSGIPLDFQSSIFNKFSQADSSDTKKKSGTGLGLSISKAIVERHHGKIGFTSAVGVGTEFYFELPIYSA